MPLLRCLVSVSALALTSFVAHSAAAQSAPPAPAPASGGSVALPEVQVITDSAPKPKPTARAKPQPASAPATDPAEVDAEAIEAAATDAPLSPAQSAVASPGRALRNSTTSVSTIDGVRIETYGTSNPYDALSGSPNLTPVPAGGEFLPPIRGADSGGPTGLGLGGGILFGTFPAAPLIVDDVARISSLVNSSFLSGFDLEYVEVLRGPQLMLPGASGFSGAFVVKTRGPSFENEARAFSEFTWNEYSGPTYRVAGMANAPIVANELAVRLVAEYEDGNSPFTVRDAAPGNPFALPPAPPGTDYDPLNDFDALRLRAKVLATPASVPGLSVLLQGEYEEGTDQGFDSFVNNERITGRPVEDRIYTWGNQRILDTESMTGIVNAAYQLGGGVEVRSISSFVREEYADNPNSNEARVNFDSSIEERYAQDFALSYGTSRSANGVAGVTLVRHERTGELSGFAITQDNLLTSQAFYVDTSTPIIDRWRLLAGGRVQHHENSVQSEYFGGFGVVDYTDSDTVFLPKVGASYDVSPTDTITATVRRGYNLGGSTLSFQTLTPYEWEAEKVWTYEVGYAGRAMNDRLTFNATAFFNDYENKQFYLTTITRDTIILNEPEAQSYGLELEGRLAVTQSLDVFGGLGLVNTEITAITPTTPAGIKGNDFGLDPSATFIAGASWRPFDGFELSGKITYVAEYFGDFENDPLELSGDYVTADLAASYTYRNVTARAFVTNITDEFAVFQELADSGPYVLAPRTFGTSLDIKF